MAGKDLVSKHLLKRLVVDLARYLFGLEIEALEVLDTEQQRIEGRRADLVVLAREGAEEFLLQIEVQADNDSRMPVRMLRYRTDLMLAHPGRSLRQYVIYIGGPRLNMADGVQDWRLDYRFGLIDMHRVDCRLLMDQGSPDALVLAILCDFQGREPRSVVREILSRLQALTRDSPRRFRDYLTMLEILSTSRDLTDTIREEEKMLTVSIEELPSYTLGREAGVLRGLEQGLEQGLERGLEQGELTRARATLVRLIELKFGPLDGTQRARIEAAGLDLLTEWTDRVLAEDGIEAVLR